MDKIKALVEQALLSEDHLTLQDKPEDAQAVKFEVGEDTFEGWVAKNGEEFHVVMFKQSDKVDMYIEEKCTCEDGAKSLIVQMIKTLQDTREEPSDEEDIDGEEESDEDEKPAYPFAAPESDDEDENEADEDEEKDLDEGLDDSWKGRLRRAYDRAPDGPGKLERAMDDARLSSEERQLAARTKGNLDHL